MLDENVPHSPYLRLREKGKARISLSPLPAQPEPSNLDALGIEIAGRWPMTSLLDILKEADLRLGLTDHFTTIASRQILDPDTLRKRLLLCLYGLGTNTGLKRVAAGDPETGYQDLRYVRRRFIHKEQLRAAIACVVDGIFTARSAEIWGETTTACASDSKKFGAWDQNLMTQWSIRHRGRGVMIYTLRGDQLQFSAPGLLVSRRSGARREPPNQQAACRARCRVRRSCPVRSQ